MLRKRHCADAPLLGLASIVAMSARQSRIRAIAPYESPPIRASSRRWWSASPKARSIMARRLK